MTPEIQEQADAATKAANATPQETPQETPETNTPTSEVQQQKEIVVPAELDLTATVVQPVAATGVQAIDDIAKLLTDKKVKSAQAIIDNFSATGELSLADKATMIESLGESVATIAIQQLETTAANIRNTADAAKKDIMEYAAKLFGSDDANLVWTQIQEFARSPESGFSDADLQAMNSMLAAGGLQAKLVIDKVQSVYNSAGSTTTPADLLMGDTYTTNSFDPISRQDYSIELDKAVRKYGEDSQQVNQLNNRRMQTMQFGK